METLIHLARPFVRAWMVSRSSAEVARRMGGAMTIAQVRPFARHLFQNGVKLPARPGARAPRQRLALTRHPEVSDIFIDPFGRHFTQVGPQATFLFYKHYEEGPWECQRCKSICSGGWVRFTHQNLRQFSCNRCVAAIG
jgi:hypothetical protein